MNDVPDHSSKLAITMSTCDATSTRPNTPLNFRWPLRVMTVSALSLLPACASQMAFMADQAPTTINNVDTLSRSPELAARNNLQPNTSVSISESADRPAGHVRLGTGVRQDSAVRTAVLTEDSASPASSPKIIPLSHRAEVGGRGTDSHHFTPAETRLNPAFGSMSPADLYPDEYVADGGDRQLPVHYYDGSRQGFDTEDTIAEYSDHHGQSHVRASNRVAVYAPRFGSVQVVEGANSGIRVSHAAKTTEFSGAGSLERLEATKQSSKEQGFVAVGSRQRADGAEANQNPIHSTATVRPQRNDKVDQGLQAESINGRQILERQQGAGFHRELANAAIWSRDLFPELSAATAQAAQTHRRLTAQATIGIDDQRAEKSEIHIVKLADRETAAAGEIIHFTIRYINTGDYDLHDVRIVDNLTPRLHFVPDSVQTDRAGDIITEPNGEGSEILTFVLDDALPAHESGTIEFEVRVK